MDGWMDGPMDACTELHCNLVRHKEASLLQPILSRMRPRISVRLESSTASDACNNGRSLDRILESHSTSLGTSAPYYMAQSFAWQGDVCFELCVGCKNETSDARALRCPF